MSTAAELLAEKRTAEKEKYDAAVAKAASKMLSTPTEQERAMLKAICPGWRDPVQTFMDVSVNKSALKMVRKAIKAMEPWLK